MRFNFLVFFAIFALGTAYAQATVTGGNPSVFSQDASHSVGISVDSGRTFLSYSAGLSAPLVMTYVADDGSVSVCSATDTTTYVYEYTADLRHTKTTRFQNDFPKFGAFAKDNQGNYYFFYAKEVEENQKDVENLSLVKYDGSGRRVNTYRLKALADGSFSGIKLPFRSGACRMEISGNMLAVYFARQMFQSLNDGLNHQASYGFVVNKDTLERVDSGAATNSHLGSNNHVPYVSHSFNQFILPVENGFLFADHGDAYPRSFVFSKFQAGGATKRLEAFRFKEGQQHYNYTFAQLGGLAQTSDGYIFAGTYEKNSIADGNHNDSRNLFVLTFDNELNSISNPLWITNYTNKETHNAINPKIAALDTGRCLLMWELIGSGGYETTYMAIIDKTGRLLAAAREMPGIRLNMNDALRYNRTNRNVYWAVDNHDKNIDIFSFNPDNQINMPARTGASIGGHGVVLESFAVDKTQASQHELLTVRANIRNIGFGIFPGGQIGGVLVDNSGNIVEVIGIANVDALNPNQHRSNRTIMCAAPNTVRPGQYRLRMVIRPTGGEWRVATLTTNGIPNAIPIAVTAGGANAGGHGLALTHFVVNDGKDSAAQGERFGIALRAIKVGMEAFPGGQIGVALADNHGNIVEVIATRDWAALEGGAGARSQSMSNITVPRTATQGRYKLRVVVRPTGGEWRIVTMSADGIPTGIDFTVR